MVTDDESRYWLDEDDEPCIERLIAAAESGPSGPGRDPFETLNKVCKGVLGGFAKALTAALMAIWGH